MQIRDIVIEKKGPRQLVMNNNLVRYNESQIEPIFYPSCFEGIIASSVDRFPKDVSFLKKVHDEWAKTSAYLRV